MVLTTEVQAQKLAVEAEVRLVLVMPGRSKHELRLAVRRSAITHCLVATQAAGAAVEISPALVVAVGDLRGAAEATPEQKMAVEVEAWVLMLLVEEAVVVLVLLGQVAQLPGSFAQPGAALVSCQGEVAVVPSWMLMNAVSVRHLVSFAETLSKGEKVSLGVWAPLFRELLEQPRAEVWELQK